MTRLGYIKKGIYYNSIFLIKHLKNIHTYSIWIYIKIWTGICFVVYRIKLSLLDVVLNNNDKINYLDNTVLTNLITEWIKVSENFRKKHFFKSMRIEKKSADNFFNFNMIIHRYYNRKYKDVFVCSSDMDLLGSKTFVMQKSERKKKHCQPSLFFHIKVRRENQCF